ncbi:MAG: hypothetical protein ABMB14_30875, partial [Myxococcota bacterium]
MGWWVGIGLASAASADPGGCTPTDDLRAALQAWLEPNPAATTEALRAAAVAFGCSAPVEPQTLARYWLIEGAVAQREGDAEEAGDDFAAARRLAPEVW